MSYNINGFRSLAALSELREHSFLKECDFYKYMETTGNVDEKIDVPSKFMCVSAAVMASIFAIFGITGNLLTIGM